MTGPVDRLQREAAGEHPEGTSGKVSAYGAATPGAGLVAGVLLGGYGIHE